MRKYTSLLLIICLAYVACDNNDGVGVNEDPSVPMLLSPEDYQLLDSPAVSFLWESSVDPEGEEITYNLQISDSADFTRIIFSDELNQPSFDTTLNAGVFYYWRVRAKDASNNTSAFSRRQNLIVRDAAISNYPPFAPDLRFPELDAAIDVNQAQLGWVGFDLDDTDLTYDIYLGTEFGNLTLFAENIEEMEVTLNLDPAEVYYWRVEASDPSGQRTRSPIWWFKSE